MSDLLVPELIVRFERKFSAIRVIGNRFVPTTWTINAEIFDVEEQEGYTEDELDLEAQITMEKIKHWMDNYLNNSLIFSSGNEWASSVFFNQDNEYLASNVLVTTPGTPNDSLILEILHSKFNALGGGIVEFGLIECKSDDPASLTFMFTGVGEDNLPTNEEWMGGNPSVFDKPWWARNDASTYDVVDDGSGNLPKSATALDFIRKRFEPVVEPEVIKFTGFRPEVVSGGKEE